MTITTSVRQSVIPPEEVAKAKRIVAELKARNIAIPKDFLVPSATWPKVGGFFPSRDSKPYIPNEHQAKFFNSNARFVALISGRGGGKTACGSQKALQKIEMGLDGTILNPDFENFKISTWPEFKKWIPPTMVHSKHRYRLKDSWQPTQPFVMTFVTGANVILKGLKNPDSARGPNVNWLWYDEGGRDETGLGWQLANAGVRLSPDPQSWLTTTPKGKLHWIHELFVDEKIDEEALKVFGEINPDRKLVEYFTTTISDNKDNLDPGFYASMLALYPKGWLRKRELEGLFVDEGGVLTDLSWFNGKFLDSRPEYVFKRVRYWDLAATEKKISGKNKNDPDETVGTLMSYIRDGEKKIIEDQKSGYIEWADIKKLIVDTALEDGPQVEIRVEQEPGAGGKNQVAEIKLHLQEKLPGWPLPKEIGHTPSGDKIVRANIWFSEAKDGKIYIVRGAWNKDFLAQFSSFPEVKHDDKIDSVSGARICIAPLLTWSRTEFITVNTVFKKDEQDAES